MSSVFYRKGYSYQLAKDYICQIALLAAPAAFDWVSLDKDGVLTIKANYCWDGASGPAVDTKSNIRGSLIHDALYQLIRLNKLDKVYRASADKEYYNACREDGMNIARAWMHFRILRRFAAYAAEPRSEQKLESAP